MPEKRDLLDYQQLTLSGSVFQDAEQYPEG
jgi:hypothetical protein